MNELDTVIRATATRLHEPWQRVASQIAAKDESLAATDRNWN